MRNTVVVGLCLLLAACKSDGPSASDLSRIYAGNAVNLISCAKVGDSVYRCRFSFTNPRFQADQGEHTQCFVTDGSRWELKIFC